MKLSPTAPGTYRKAERNGVQMAFATLGNAHSFRRMKSDILIVKSSTAPLERVCQRLPEVAQKHKFGVLGTHDLKEKMVSKGVPFERECRVYEVCNPQQAQRVLTQAMAVSTALPCRISVYEENGRTVLATIKPTAMLTMFEVPGAAAIAREVEDAMIAIMEETAREA
jgi:uncharacterized protein (DUF302 family)